MYPDKDTKQRIAICDMTAQQAETLQAALVRILPDLPENEKREFKSLLIQLDRLLPVGTPL